MLTPLKYPAYDSFVDSVRLEAEQNVRRLRHHPSLVIWGSLPLPKVLLYRSLPAYVFQLETTKVPLHNIASFETSPHTMG